MNELIRVESRYLGEGDQVVQTVNARELHGFLGVGKDFSNWIKDQLERARLVRWRDYCVTEVSAQKGEYSQGGRPRTEYFLTLESAKHVAMMAGTDKGFEVREYFIECERRVKSSPAIPQSLPEALRLAADLAERNAQQAQLIEQQKPAVEFFEKYAEAESTKNSKPTRKLYNRLFISCPYLPLYANTR